MPKNKKAKNHQNFFHQFKSFITKKPYSFGIAFVSTILIVGFALFNVYQNISSADASDLEVNHQDLIDVSCVDSTEDFQFNFSAQGFEIDAVSTIEEQPDGKILVGMSVYNDDSNPKQPLTRLNPDGSKDENFNLNFSFGRWGVSVTSIALQEDGKILVGGSFRRPDNSLHHLIRLNPNGSKDQDFMSNIGSGTLGNPVIKVQKDNKILLGGFGARSFNGIPKNGMIRLNADGSVDNSFDIGSGFVGGSGVNTIAIQDDGKILAGGEFTMFNDSPQNRIIRLKPDGSKDNSFDVGSGFSNDVNTIAIQDDGKILAGGVLDSFNGVHGNRFLNRLNPDGSADESFDTRNTFPSHTSNFRINSMAIQPDGKILIGILRINSDGSIDHSFNLEYINGGLTTIKQLKNGAILLGGQFEYWRSEDDLWDYWDYLDGYGSWDEESKIGENLVRLIFNSTFVPAGNSLNCYASLINQSWEGYPFYSMPEIFEIKIGNSATGSQIENCKFINNGDRGTKVKCTDIPTDENLTQSTDIIVNINGETEIYGSVNFSSDTDVENPDEDEESDEDEDDQPGNEGEESENGNDDDQDNQGGGGSENEGDENNQEDDADDDENDQDQNQDPALDPEDKIITFADIHPFNCTAKENAEEIISGSYLTCTANLRQPQKYIYQMPNFFSLKIGNTQERSQQCQIQENQKVICQQVPSEKTTENTSLNIYLTIKN